MKKTLIAMAAVAVAGTASAQVTIGGTMTFDALTKTKTTTRSAADVVTSSTADDTGRSNTLTTSQLLMSGTEDLGGGMSIGFVMNTGSDGGSFGARDRNLNLSSDTAGSVRVGRFIPSASMGFYGYSGAATTAAGSIYGVGSGSATIFGATSQVAGSFERNDNQLQYTSPTFDGLTFTVNYGSTSTDESSTLGQVATKQQGYSIAYAAGALSAGAGRNTRDVEAAEGSASAIAAKIDGELDWYGIKYDMGVATLKFTNVQRKDQTAAATTGAITVSNDININSFGVSVPMGSMTFSASMFRGDNDVSAAATDNMDLSGNQLMVNYALSKRTSIYAVTGQTDAKRASGNTASVATKVTRTSAGILHTF